MNTIELILGVFVLFFLSAIFMTITMIIIYKIIDYFL